MAEYPDENPSKPCRIRPEPGGPFVQAQKKRPIRHWRNRPPASLPQTGVPVEHAARRREAPRHPSPKGVRYEREPGREVWIGPLFSSQYSSMEPS